MKSFTFDPCPRSPPDPGRSLASGIAAQRLRDVGIPADAVRTMAEDAMRRTRLLVDNPRRVALADARAIYEAPW